MQPDSVAETTSEPATVRPGSDRATAETDGAAAGRQDQPALRRDTDAFARSGVPHLRPLDGEPRRRHGMVEERRQAQVLSGGHDQPGGTVVVRTEARQPWHGHYLGVFGGFTWYDLENGKEGYQGEAEMVGVSYGYMFPIGRRLSLEAGIGLGYMHSKYEVYDPIPYLGGTHYVYRQTSKLDYFGPLKLKLTLVWRLWNTDKKKGGAR